MIGGDRRRQMTRAPAAQCVQARIRRGDAQGATINVVGRLLELSGASVEATVIAEVTSEVDIRHDEAFEPVAIVYPRIRRRTRWSRRRALTMVMARRSSHPIRNRPGTSAWPSTQSWSTATRRRGQWRRKCADDWLRNSWAHRHTDRDSRYACAHLWTRSLQSQDADSTTGRAGRARHWGHGALTWQPGLWICMCVRAWRAMLQDSPVKHLDRLPFLCPAGADSHSHLGGSPTRSCTGGVG